MKELKARSGREVKVFDNGHVAFDHGKGYLDAGSVMDAEEYFQAKHDEDLGRWRWPENPDYVVYPIGHYSGCTALCESTGVSKTYITRDSVVGDGSYLAPAARAFLEAHPVRTLWDDAKVGEIWAVTLNGREEPCRVIQANLSTEAEGGIAFLPVDAHGRTWFRPSHLVTAARRVWPEVAS